MDDDVRSGTPQVDLLASKFLEAESCAAAQVPPALHRFTKAADKNLAETLFKLLLKYRPEDKAAKKQRLLSEVRAASPVALGRIAGGHLPASPPL